MSKQADVLIRRNEVRELLLSGKNTQHIYSFIIEKYGVTKSVVMRDIAYTYSDVREYLNRNIEDVLATHIGRYERIYELSMDMYNTRDAMKALESIEKLLKMHTAQPLIQYNQLNLNNVDDKTLLDIVQQLKDNDNGQIK